LFTCSWDRFLIRKDADSKIFAEGCSGNGIHIRLDQPGRRI
jgi:hypothetical protein